MLGTSAAANTVTVGPRAALATRRVALRGVVSCTGRAPTSTASACATTRRRAPAASRASRTPAATARLALALDAPVDGVAPGQVACLMRGDTVLGWGVIAACRGPGSRGRVGPRLSRVTSDEIRERFLSFFEDRGHLRLPSAPLVPTAYDPSTLLISAGMHPLKPYFLGQEAPPQDLLTTCQKCFRTVDIDQVGLTHRHLTFFEMLGNFSIGDYFKQGAVEFAWELSLQGFGFDPERIWITVFEGDEELGEGPDEEAIEAWLGDRGPARADRRAPALGELLAGRPDRPVRAVLGALPRPRARVRPRRDDLPGGDNERFLEYWNLVFMQYDQDPVNTLTPLPAQNIDTGLGLNRLAAVLQGTTSVFETDQFQPLIGLSQELSGRRYGEGPEVDRAMRILADHTRGMSFLIADGVVPSNEDRGYVLRRIMRRAILQGRRIGIEPGFLGAFAGRVRGTMGAAYPELLEHADTIDMWLATEEEALRAHARAGHADPRRPRRARQGGRRGGHRRRGGLPAARHLRLPVRPDAGAGRRAGPRGRLPGLRGADGRPAGARPHEPGPWRARRHARAHPGLRRRRGLRHRVHGL